MDQIAKILRKAKTADREKLLLVLRALRARDFSNLKRKKLKGYEHIYRVRVGNYRVIYFDDGEDLIVKHVKQRNERTYREL